jgi:hypothetical protein
VHLLTVLAELLLIGWLPGAVLFRAPVTERDRRAALDAEERAFWAVAISVALSLSVTLALAAAHRYSFTRLLVADALVTAGAGLVSRLRLRLGPAARKPSATVLVPIVLVVICGWRFFPPSEYVIGGKDPGVYVNEGIQIAQRGALVVHDSVVASVPPFARDLFFPSHQRSEYYSVRFMGFFIQDPDTGAVVGQFPHLFPASIAIGYGLDGLTGARRTVGVWAILGVLAVYFAGVRLVGRPAAAAGAGLLALHVIQVWFARYPNAEVVMQALLFAALLANARAHVDRDVFFAPVAAVLLVLLVFLRFDAVLGIAGVLAGIALSVFKARRPRWPFFVTLGAGTVLAIAYLLGPLRAYAYLPTVFLSNLPWWEYALLAAGALAGTAMLLAGARQPRIAATVVVIMPILLIAAAIVLSLYALTWRHPGGKLTDYDAYALRTFVLWYLTLPGFIAALVGYVLVTRRAFWQSPALLLTITIFSCFFFYKIRIVPDHFWMARRFLPVILPGALLLASAAALGWERGGTQRVRSVRHLIGLTFVALLAIHYAGASRLVLPHVEYAGIIPRLEQLSGTIRDDELLIVESRDASDTHVLGLPLAYIYARNVLVLASRLPDKAVFAAFLDWAHTRYTRVLFMGGGGTDLLSRNWSVVPIASERFQVPEYDAPRNGYPRGVRRKEFDYSVYAFTAPTHAAVGPFDLDVGVRDDLHVLRFHAKEISEGVTYRWSRDVSYLSITSIASGARQLILWMNDGGRPLHVQPAEVSVYLANQHLGSVRVVTGFHAYSFPIPPDLVGRVASSGDPVQLKLVTPVWNPSRVLGTSDDRELGVMVDRVAVR